MPILKKLFPLAVLFFIPALVAMAQTSSPVQMHLPPGNYSRDLVATALRDPAGQLHTGEEALGKVVVVIFSVPDMSQGGHQQTWSTLLADDPKTRISPDAALVLIEDMKQTGFSGDARKEMKKEYKPGDRPLLLLDETGATRLRYGVPRDKTYVMIFDKTTTLRDVETASPNRDEALRVRQIVRQLLAEQPPAAPPTPGIPAP